MENKNELIFNEYQLTDLFFNSPRFIPSMEDINDGMTMGELFKHCVDTHFFEIGKCYLMKNRINDMYNYTYHIWKVQNITDREIVGEYIEVAPYNIHYGKNYCPIITKGSIINGSIINDNIIKEISVDIFNDVKKKVFEYDNLHNIVIASRLPFRINGNMRDYTGFYYQLKLDNKLGIPYNNDFSEVKLSDLKKRLQEYNSSSMDKLNNVLKTLKEELIDNHRYLLIDNGYDKVDILCFDDFYIDSDEDTKNSCTINKIRCKYHFVNSVKIKPKVFLFFTYIDLQNDSNIKDDAFNEIYMKCRKKEYYFIDNNIGDKLFTAHDVIYNEVSETFNIN